MERIPAPRDGSFLPQGTVVFGALLPHGTVVVHKSSGERCFWLKLLYFLRFSGAVWLWERFFRFVISAWL